MDKNNELVENLNDLKEELPVTYHFLQSIKGARNQLTDVDPPAFISIELYESKSIEPSGFYRPISKIVKITNK